MDLFFIHNLWIKKEKSKLKLITIIFIIKTIKLYPNFLSFKTALSKLFISNKINYELN